MRQIIVLGGGASGLMAAIQAARLGAAVTVLEHNDRPGRKLLATGNGRCNLSNTSQAPWYYHSSRPDFPWQAVSRFPLADTLRFFTELGLYTRNRNGGLYPYSGQASCVAELLRIEALRRKVKLKLTEEVSGLETEPQGGFLVRTATWSYRADAVICCLGSPASSVAGSSETGFSLAKALGHTVIPPLPALTGLCCRGSYFSAWAGVRAEGGVSLLADGENTGLTEIGELQLTDYGVSGIPVFQLSGLALRLLSQGKRVSLVLDFFPDLEEEALRAFLQARTAACPQKTPEQQLLSILPEKLIRVLLKGGGKKGGVSGDAAFLMKNWSLEVTKGAPLSQAQVCSGGVDPAEICPDTMESLLVPGLYFAGEVVDVDGACGGYNLQWAWSSGAVAGRSAAENCAAEKESGI